LAAGYDSRTLPTYRRAYDRSIEKTRAILSPGQRVLEIGCGTGIISLGVAPFAGQIVGADISPQMIEVARHKAQEASVDNVEFQVCDGYSLPFEDEVFDAVLIFNTLHAVKEPATMLAEARRLLKPAGHLLTATDCYAAPAPFATRLMLAAQRLMKLVGVIPFMSYLHEADIQRLIEAAGFDVVETDVLHPAPVNYYLRARKAEAPA
jgi:ubiquinone/menaquinone biosynthesis C-methylase UbiE